MILIDDKEVTVGAIIVYVDVRSPFGYRVGRVKEINSGYIVVDYNHRWEYARVTYDAIQSVIEAR